MARILTVEEAAEKLRISAKTTRRMLKMGKLPGRKVGRAWRVVETDLEWFLRGSVRQAPVKRISAMGICADIEGLSSEDFIGHKQEEIDLENRRWQESGKDQ